MGHLVNPVGNSIITGPHGLGPLGGPSSSPRQVSASARDNLAPKVSEPQRDSSRPLLGKLPHTPTVGGPHSTGKSPEKKWSPIFSWATWKGNWGEITLGIPGIPFPTVRKFSFREGVYTVYICIYISSRRLICDIRKLEKLTVVIAPIELSVSCGFLHRSVVCRQLTTNDV